MRGPGGAFEDYATPPLLQEAPDGVGIPGFLDLQAVRRQRFERILRTPLRATRYLVMLSQVSRLAASSYTKPLRVTLVTQNRTSPALRERDE